ncbi:PREDICTED: putative F-box protein At1g31090 [Camelina sativa]|uniref:F-box protein At1g31090 n=1 Tax=Camelina sativa TaxID=90675 RepID=A0ABM0WZV0_CAMSA|nr:PREDICTED: putative F-box protein At1g31090 [Camelina sativa]
MNRGANSLSLPNDLIPEILSRLPAKSIRRFRCVSKLWASIICRQDFTELFHTRSSSNPRLLIGVEQDGEWSFFSSPQPQSHYEKSSLVIADSFHMKFTKDMYPYYCKYVSGLTYFPNTRISKDGGTKKMWSPKDGDYKVRVICNPSTGQYAILPPDLNKNFDGFLGFDPIGKQFKVLVLSNRVSDELSFDILTLGTENMRWRNIQCPLPHYPHFWSGEICINGVLYYLTQSPVDIYDVVVCFDVRSEKFRYLNLNSDCPSRSWATKLINYKGKLGVINFEDDYDGGFPLKLCMWVVTDVVKHEWTAYAYTLRAENKVNRIDFISIVGVTASGEIVLANNIASKPLYVFYFNPERNTLQSVEIEGVRVEKKSVLYYYFVDHVEDLRFDVMKTTYAATSISEPEQSTST